MRPLLFSVILFTCVISSADELDDFVDMRTPPADAVNIVNEAVNYQLEKIVKGLNSIPEIGCDRSQIVDAILYSLDSNFTQIDFALRKMQDKRIEREPDSKFYEIISKAELSGEVNQDKTIYKEAQVLGCCFKRLNLNGIMVGSDKVGHFFGNGGDLWRSLENSKNDSRPLNDSDILKINVHTEHSMWGLGGPGIKSYGDMAANYQGYQFYKQLLDGPNPYFVCKKNKLSLMRKFDIGEFVDGSWNESINCSSYNNSDNARAVQKEVAARGKSCPVNRETCRKLKDKYWLISPDVQRSILSPLCLAPDSHFSQVESPVYINWDEFNKVRRGGLKQVVLTLTDKNRSYPQSNGSVGSQ